MDDCRRVMTVVGARPQFVKAAVVSRALAERGGASPFAQVLVHTGQHYDAQMSDVFFRELGIPEPHHHLGVGSATPHAQLAAMVERLGEVVRSERPDAILVYGDTNSTLAAALVATQQDVPLVHVEAGERIYRRFQVPEEINRVLTDHSASLCLTSTRRGERYLLREGMSRQRVRFVGDPMYDLFVWASERLHVHARVTPGTYGMQSGEYVLSTIHRAQNTSSFEQLRHLLETLDGSPFPVLLPVHPRVGNMLRTSGWAPRGALRLTEPLGYFDFLALLRECRVCVTDSGGVTREAYFARKPVVVPMENCWWPEVVESGWAIEAGTSRERILDAIRDFPEPSSSSDELFGDGRSADRIIDETAALLGRDGTHAAWHRRGSVTCLPASRPTSFTHTGYRALLRRLGEGGYACASFPEALQDQPSGRRSVLLRHDIDFDLEAALRMAEVEAEEGFCATYFLMVRTDHYNVFSSEGTATASRILDLGHHLGLHFDCAAYPAHQGVEATAEAVAQEAAMLAGWFRRPVEIVSFHRPDAKVLSGDRRISGAIPHTYQSEFTQQIVYFSDSRGQWRFGEPTESEAFAAGRPLQILVHPIWWRERATGPYEVLHQYLDSNLERLDESIAANCDVYRTAPLPGDR